MAAACPAWLAASPGGSLIKLVYFSRVEEDEDGEPLARGQEEGGSAGPPSHTGGALCDAMRCELEWSILPLALPSSACIILPACQ